MKLILIFIFLVLMVPLSILLYKNSAVTKRPYSIAQKPITNNTPYPTRDTQTDLSSMLFVVDTHTTIVLTNSQGQKVGNLSTEGGMQAAGSTNAQPLVTQLLYTSPPNGTYLVKASSTERTFTVGMYLYDKSAAVKMEKFENTPSAQTVQYTIIFNKQDIQDITVEKIK